MAATRVPIAQATSSGRGPLPAVNEEDVIIILHQQQTMHAAHNIPNTIYTFSEGTQKGSLCTYSALCSITCCMNPQLGNTTCICTGLGLTHTQEHTVHDTENLTFSAEFRDCSARNDAEFPRGCRGTSARVLRNFRAGAAELPCGLTRIPRGWTRIFRAGGRGSSVRIRVENGENQKAKFVRNNAKGSRNTPQGSFELSL